MAALEAAAARDEDSQSPQPQGSNKNASKGKCDMKADDDIKKEMDDTDSNQMGGAGGGKNVSNVHIKSEKVEPMDHEDSSSNNKVIKQEPMSPSGTSTGDMKSTTTGPDVKTVVPEPLPSTSSKDTKKKCGEWETTEKLLNLAIDS